MENAQLKINAKNIETKTSINKNPIQLRREFSQKTALLKKAFEGRQIAPYQMLTTIFKDDNCEMKYTIESKGAVKEPARGFDELIDIAHQRSDIYISMGTYFKNYLSQATLKEIHALVVDLDHITPSDLKQLITNIDKHHTVKPTIIMNSGQGVHLYYIFDQPVQCFKQVKSELKEMQYRLENQFINPSAAYKVDRHSIVQSYRVTGSLTKLGDLTQAFKSGRTLSIAEVAKWLGVALKTTTNPITQQTVLKSKKTIIAAPKVRTLPNARKGLYSHIYKRMTEVEPGNRHTALLALAVAAYKCRIGKVQLEADLRTWCDYYNQRDTRQLTEKELTTALKFSNKKSIGVKSETLEEWLGFTFPRTTKRNGQSQVKHLAECNKIKHSMQSEQIKETLQQYRIQNPTASQSQIAKDLKMSRNTVVKYLKNTCSLPLRIEPSSPSQGPTGGILVSSVSPRSFREIADQLILMKQSFCPKTPEFPKNIESDPNSPFLAIANRIQQHICPTKHPT